MVVVLTALFPCLSLAAGLPPFLFTEAPIYEPAAWSQGCDRFPGGARLVLVAGGVRRELVPAFFASGDAAVSYDGRRVLFAGRSVRQDPWQIWQLDLAGGGPVRVTANPDACIRPLYLPDGRIAYTRITAGSSRIEVLRPGSGETDVLTHAPGPFLSADVLRDGRILFESEDDLFTVYPDGTGLESFRCDHGQQRWGSRQVSSGDLIFSVTGGLARFTSALAVQQSLPPADLEIAGPVAEVAADRWLIAARPRAGGHYAIYDGEPGLRVFRLLAAPHDAHAVDPVVVAARVPPRDFPSARVTTRTNGNVLCLNARDARNPIATDARSVRFYSRRADGSSDLLGETPLASDGSFYVEVPADRPIRLELVDAAGARLRSEERWFWMRPSEQRVCVGCHLGPERAPENRVPEILNQLLNPVKLLGEHGPNQ
jgi:hypothetical protein